MKSTLFKLSTLFILLSACGGESAKFDLSTNPESVGFMENDVVMQKKPDETTVKGTTINNTIEKKIIKTANISIEVKEFKNARASLTH